MTITISLEELRVFEAAVQNWGLDRAAHVMKLGQAVLQRGGTRFSSEPVVDIRPEIAKWDAEHPMPKLIPSV